jgi:hypothetical protein
MPKKPRGGLIALKAAGLTIAFLLAGLYCLVWYRTWSPFLDDGPFHGVNRVDIPDGKPDQVFGIYGGLKLEVFDPHQDEPAPTVQSKNGRDEVLWCIYAVADGMTNTTVRRIRFKDWRHFPFKQPRAYGMIEWTYGREASWWFIARDGRLVDYWYSW